MSQVGDTFMQFPDPDKTSPEEFELTIKRWFESFSETLDSFETEHRQKMSGTDGEFEIDVSVRFTAFGGATFLVICECKKHRNPIKREIVQVLNDRKRSVGAQKAILVSTAKFQSGAETYASKHGIALIQLVSGALRYIQASADKTAPTIPENADPYAGLFSFKDDNGRKLLGVVTSDFTSFLEDFLKTRSSPDAET